MPMAMKIIRKEDMIRKNSVNRVKLEAHIYRLLEDPKANMHVKTINAQFSDCIIKFYGSFKSATHLFIVLDYCPHGDLGRLL